MKKKYNPKDVELESYGINSEDVDAKLKKAVEDCFRRTYSGNNKKMLDNLKGY